MAGIKRTVLARAGTGRQYYAQFIGGDRVHLLQDFFDQNIGPSGSGCMINVTKPEPFLLH